MNHSQHARSVSRSVLTRPSRHRCVGLAALLVSVLLLTACGPVTIESGSGGDGGSRMRAPQSGELDFQAVVGPKDDGWAVLILAEGTGALAGTTQVATVRGPDGWRPYCCGATTHDVRYRVGRPGEPEVRVFFEDRTNANFVSGTYTVETIVAGKRYEASTTASSASGLESAQNVRSDVLNLSRVQARWNPVEGAEVYRICIETPHVPEVIVDCVWSQTNQADVHLGEPLERRGWGHYHVSVYAFSTDVRSASHVDLSRPFSVSQGAQNIGDTTGL